MIEKLQAARMALPVIMIHPPGRKRNWAACDLLQPAKTLIKPYTFNELLAAVKEVLRAAGNSLGKTARPPKWQI